MARHRAELVADDREAPSERLEAASGERIAFEAYDSHRSKTGEREPDTDGGFEREDSRRESRKRTIEPERAPDPVRLEHQLGL